MIWGVVFKAIGGWKGVLIGLAVAGLAGMITLGYRHYTGLVDEKAELSATVARLEERERTLQAQNDTYEEVLRRNRLAAEEQEQQIQQLARDAAAARSEARRLNDIFAEHDFTRITLAKPGLIERRVNAGTARAGRLLECASSGACPADQ